VAEDGLIVQRLDDELLVYDTASNEAHVLGGAVAVEFERATDEVSRREVIRRLALAGAAAAGTTALVRSIVAPTAANAQSGCVCGNGTCPPNTGCDSQTSCLICDITSPAVCGNALGCVCCNGAGHCTASFVVNGATC
jgi:hypothetical protein